jgi:hypothetical protein
LKIFNERCNDVKLARCKDVGKCRGEVVELMSDADYKRNNKRGNPASYYTPLACSRARAPNNEAFSPKYTLGSPRVSPMPWKSRLKPIKQF